MRLMYELWYRWSTPPWSGSPRKELTELVSNGTLLPGRAIDLGCGTGENCVFLAQNGFDVTGVDFAQSAIRKARAKATEAGVDVDFQVDDLTGLKNVSGKYDLLVDYGTFDDLKRSHRVAYMNTVNQLIRPGSKFLFWCFEWPLNRWDRILDTVTLPFGPPALEPGEVESLFGDRFEIDRFASEVSKGGFMRGWAAYLMTAK